MNTPSPLNWAALIEAAWRRDRVALKPYIESLPMEQQQIWQSIWDQDSQIGIHLGRYRYGDQVADVYGAEGVRGLVLASTEATPDAVLRLKDPSRPKGFRDYEWRHCDLAVRIEDGYEVAFYHLADGRAYLDHAPETLGLERVA